MKIKGDQRHTWVLTAWIGESIRVEATCEAAGQVAFDFCKILKII
ncbi:MAG: hypothetical protein N838_23625 [Thiohalocapsa sp. PB-PSB1]|nr:MAG: hypothetical protein N838_23625 [Thiohalocapsa sp. PB-PSB1]